MTRVPYDFPQHGATAPMPARADRFVRVSFGVAITSIVLAVISLGLVSATSLDEAPMGLVGPGERVMITAGGAFFSALVSGLLAGSALLTGVIGVIRGWSRGNATKGLVWGVVATVAVLIVALGFVPSANATAQRAVSMGICADHIKAIGLAAKQHMSESQYQPDRPAGLDTILNKDGCLVPGMLKCPSSTDEGAWDYFYRSAPSGASGRLLVLAETACNHRAMDGRYVMYANWEIAFLSEEDFFVELGKGFNEPFAEAWKEAGGS